MGVMTLPELGESIESADVTRVLVRPGERVVEGQGVIEVESEKATLEVPAAAAGVVAMVHVKPGDHIRVGAPVVTVEAVGTAAPSPAPAAAAPAPPPAAAAVPAERRLADMEPAVASGGPAPPRPEPPGPARPPVSPPAAAAPAGPAAPAAPSVRRFAREIGVPITEVHGSGPGGRVSVEDVKAHARRGHDGDGHGAGAAPRAIAEPPLPDFGRLGRTTREPMNNIRRTTAEHIARAWSAIPHVTHHDKADITALEALRRKHAPRIEAKGGKLTVTAVAVKVVATALKVFPRLNASVDMGRQEIVYKDFIHVGVAVDTDRGLLVPVIRHADRKNLVELAVELSDLSRRARERTLALEELQGATFTISNLGGIGGTSFTPIIDWPQVAILGLSRAAVEPVYLGGQLVPRTMLPLSLSYDHRLVDGADAARFTRWVAEALGEPFLVTLEG